MQCQRLCKQIPGLKLRLSPGSLSCVTCDLEIDLTDVGNQPLKDQDKDERLYSGSA